MDINEIARRAGVSRATVSRFLNQGYVSQAKREKIARIIEETGYVPSSQAQTLRTGKTNLVGVIIPKINSASVTRMVSGMTRVFREAGYELLLANTENNEHLELDYLRMFAARNQVDGIVLVGTVLTAAHQKALETLTLPCVVVGQQTSLANCVTHDDRQAMHALAQHMLQNCAHPAYIGVTENDISAGQNRRLGFMDAVAEKNLNLAATQLEVSSFTADGGYECCERILDAHPETDGIICATDTIALGAMTCLREYQRRIPQDVIVSGVGDDEMGRLFYPGLTTIRHHYKTTGSEAAKLLLEKMDDPAAPTHDVMMSYDVIVRASSVRTHEAPPATTSLLSVR